MKKVLIVIQDMRIGGAQKSLISFLKCMTNSPKAGQYAISLMVIDPTGPFMKEIPESVTLVQPPRPLRWLGSSLSKSLIFKHFSFRGLQGECRWVIKKRFKRFPENLNLQQKLWHSWGKSIPQWKTRYDVAVSYIDGVPNYYVMDKVCASRKVLWIHNAYGKLAYQPEFDREFYEAADGVITISEECRQSFIRAFPNLANSISVLENITVVSDVLKKASEDACPEFENVPELKLLSVGRLNPQKGLDIAINAAKILQGHNIPFCWLVLGEGAEREKLQRQIDACGLTANMHLLGNRDNPYCYMKKSDMILQTSRFEGKSVVLDEAKLLNKASVVTNYSTVNDSIEHGKTGWIVDMSPEAVAEGIKTLWKDPVLKNQIESNLAGLPKGNEQELLKYCNTML